MTTAAPAPQPQDTEKPELQDTTDTTAEDEAGRAALDDAINRYKSPATQEFELNWRRATALAASDLVPTTYRKKPENCMIAIDLAERANMAPLMVMQNLDIIHGRPSWRSQYIIACINNSGRFTPLQFEKNGEGDKRQCIAWSTDKETGVRVESPPISIAMAKAEGWYSRNGSKWQTLPELMLMYRSASFFGRLYVPELLMGFPSIEESTDISGAVRGSSSTGVSIDDVLSGGAAVTNGSEKTPENGAPSAEEPERDPETGEIIPDNI